MGAGVFVSYRKDDDPGWAGRVRDALARRFGDDEVFFDVESIRGGQRWEEALDGALAASSALVLVVGPRWLHCLQERQARPEVDYHLREITMALDRGLVVYPVRVRGAAMPELAELPEVLRDRLPALQWTAVHEDLFGPSMERVLADLEAAIGVDSRPPAADRTVPGGRAEVTVGPWDSDADVHEIADAVALVAPGGRIRVRPGRYLKPLAIDRPMAIVGERGAEVLLDTDAVPAIRTNAAGVVLRHLRVRASAREGAVGVAVAGGDLAAEDVRVVAAWGAGSTAIDVAGAGTSLVLVGGDLSGAEVGLAVRASAEARVERTTVTAAGHHAVAVRDRGDARLTGCALGASGQVTLLVGDGARASVDDSSLGAGGRATIEVASDGRVAVHGSRSMATPGAIGSVTGKVARAVPGARPAVDDEARGGWTVAVEAGGTGTIEEADLALVRLGGGAVAFRSCGIGAVVAVGPAADDFDRCQIGRVTLEAGADPTFRSCTIEPDRGTKITVDVGPEGRGTFEGCEIIGRNVRDGSADPAVRVAGGAPTLRECTVRNPGEGALWVEAAGSLAVEGGEVRCSVSGPALVVVDGRAVLDGVVLAHGARVGEGGEVVLRGGELAADPVSGQLLRVLDGGRLDAAAVEVRGPGLVRARKVGRWIESKSDKVGATAARFLGAAPIEVAAGATASFERCAFVGIDAAALADSPQIDVREGTQDGEPRT